MVGSPSQAKSQAVVVLHQLENPRQCSGTAAHYFWLSGDLWLLCHFHSTGLIAPNGGTF